MSRDNQNKRTPNVVAPPLMKPGFHHVPLKRTPDSGKGADTKPKGDTFEGFLGGVP